jgi:gluconokinase
MNNHSHDPKPPYVLSLDVGTSSTRALLFDATGASVPNAHAQSVYKLTMSGDGEVSVDADVLLEVVAQTIDDAIKAAGAMTKQIAAVALDTFWHSLLAVDERGEPLTPVITWEDTRPYEAAQELQSLLDEAALHERTGARLHASYWPAKLRWLAKSQPDVFKRAAQWLSFGEYLHRKFTGHSVCSLSMASGTGMFNRHTYTWDTELMKVLDVRPEQFPALGDIHDAVRQLTSEYASMWPALRDVPWYPAVGDGAAACIGSGCVDTKHWSLTIGTSSAMRVVVEPEQVSPTTGLWLYSIDAKRSVIGGALSEGGNMLDWIDATCKLPPLADTETIVRALQPDAHGLTMLPFISGERSLGWHASARMAIMGINVHVTPADMLRAGMEALAYQLGDVYEQLCHTLKTDEETPMVIASGGALLGSPTLQGIISDLCGVPLYPSRDHEASARGAALLALEALAIIPDVATIVPLLDAPVLPNAERGAIYRKAAARQSALYKLLLQNRE